MKRRSFAAVATLTFVGVVVAAVFGGFAQSGEQTPRAQLAAADRNPGAPVQSRAAVTVDGERWTLGTYSNAAKQFCAERRMPGVGVGRGCVDTDVLFADGRELVALPGGSQADVPTPQTRWDKMWIYGFVSPKVATLHLVTTDCSEREVAFDSEGAFLHVVPRQDIARGIVPWRMLARASDGSLIEERNVSLGLSANAKKAGMAAPAPAGSC